MARCLKFNGFFGDGEDDQSEETRRAEIFISSLLLRHLQIASTNGLEMAECILRNNDITKFDIIPVGGAIFPSMSFFNHSLSKCSTIRISAISSDTGDKVDSTRGRGE